MLQGSKTPPASSPTRNLLGVGNPSCTPRAQLGAGRQQGSSLQLLNEVLLQSLGQGVTELHGYSVAQTETASPLRTFCDITPTALL